MTALIDALTLAVAPHWRRDAANDNDSRAHIAGQTSYEPIGAAAYRAVDRVDGLIARLAVRYRRSRRRRDSIDALRGLNDHMLADIGIRRADITASVDRGIAANDNHADRVA